MLIVIEIVSVLFTLLYIYYASQQKSGAWIFGILASLLSVYLFYMNQYIGSAVLNSVYAAQGVFGFFQWQFYLKNAAPAYKLSYKHHIALLLLILMLFLAINVIFASYHFNLYVRLDILLAIGSILATFLEIKKDISCWYYWMVLNLGFTVLYGIQHLYLYALLMLALGVFSYFALQQWKKKLID